MDEFDLSSLIGEFRDEAHGQLDQLDGALLALEESGSLPEEEVTALLRGLHTLKGNSGMLGFREIVAAVHVIEGAFRGEAASFPRERLDLLFEAAAAVRQAVDQVGTPQQPQSSARLSRLDLARRLDDAAAAPAPAHPPTTDPVAADPPAPAAPSEAPEPAETTDASGELLRVPFAKLDELLDLVGELTSAEAALAALLDEHADILARGGAAPGFTAVADRMERITAALRTSTMETRLVPVQRAFSRFPSLARDLARQQGKRVRVVLEGGEVELDKSLVDALADPLLHLVRNAVDHGIRTPAEREAAGKPATGTLTLRAVREGDRVRVEVEDDGRGLDPDELRRTARARGILTEQEAISAEAAAELIFRPGFSTRQTSDTVSGRGIGLDAVKQRVTTLRGTLSVENRAEGGTRFVLGFPLTLAILPALIFEAEGEILAVPTVAVERTVRGATLERAGATEVLRHEGVLIPVARAERLFGWPTAPTTPAAPGTAAASFAVVVRVGARRTALLAARLLDQRELVIKAIPRFLGGVPAVSGASVAPDGRVILLLDPAGLLDLATRGRPTGDPAQGSMPAAAQAR